MSRHYLDHASTSPLRPEARDAMVALLETTAGDPGRIHQEGMATRVALEQARGQVAARFGARSREVVFCSGATEAIATACAGAADRGAVHVATAVEHSAVRLSAARWGALRTVSVDHLGRVDPDDVVAALGDDVAIVHVQLANHEVGTVQPVAEVVAACRERDVLVHVDAAQAAPSIPIDFRALGADLLSLSAHKFGGPAGVGALLVRRGLRLRPLILGGDQERARRAGLENLLGAVGFGAAAEALEVELEARRSTDLTKRIRAVAAGVGGLVEHGDPEHHLAHLVCFEVAGIEPQAVLLGLDRRGVAAHSGSACASESLEPSPVLQAMGVDAHHSLRLSVGWSSVEADVDALADALPATIEELRSLGRPAGD